MTPAVKTFVLMLVKKIAELEAKVEELSKRDPKLTPENSSLPPSSEHPHAKSKTPKSKGSQKGVGSDEGLSPDIPSMTESSFHPINVIK